MSKPIRKPNPLFNIKNIMKPKPLLNIQYSNQGYCNACKKS